MLSLLNSKHSFIENPTRTYSAEDCGSPVELRQRTGREGREAVLSLTSDLTSSITSAASASTLVGDAMDSSAYYSGEEEEIGETTAFLEKPPGRSAGRKWSPGDDTGSQKRRLNLNLAHSHGLNLTHIESEIQFADSD